MTLDANIPIVETALRLTAAMACGIVLGLDREARGKAAGLRTQTLIAVSAAATTLVALEMYATLSAQEREGHGDPIRVIQGLAQAIGFISAGVMFQAGASVHGVTTAAVIWMAGALGIACGAGYYVIAGMGLLLSIVVTVGLRALERRLFPADRPDR
ncbi:MAG TPA: MgtC/SapB family protein [Azospirillum sp.]|nr:MgtC/SapB family protein [Azospirillum sp.]